MEKKERCFITGEYLPLSELVSGHHIGEAIAREIQKEHPGWTPEHYISLKELNRYRRGHIQQVILDNIREYSKLEKEVVESIMNRSLLSGHPDIVSGEKLTFGQRLADRIADFGGSWTFIIIFFLFILGWMAINTFLLINRSFDPYPFILLNLILSCLAAIQAPIIMMSQNRQEEKDRARAENDYKVNLKAEMEVRMLHEKLDHLLLHQSQHLLEIQEMQVEMMQDILEKMGGKKKSS